MSPVADPDASSPRPRYRPYTTGNPEIDAKLAELVKEFGDEQDCRLLTELMISAYRLGKDQASTLDLKIINSAVKELRHAFKAFKPYRRTHKVAAFGSARVTKEHPAYGMAIDFGRIMAQAGWMVITGAASGIMRAGHEGAGRDASFGLNIRLPFEQEPNAVIARDGKLVTCKYFFTRKLLFIKESHATAMFPGGFGTLDEGFESLTLVQTGKSDPRPIVFVEPGQRSFWKPLLRFMDDQLIREGMVSASDRNLYQVARSAEEAAGMILSFYAVYHSLRYVRNQVVMRLKQRVPDRLVERLATEFKDIILSGTIHQQGALPEESDEPELEDLPRLVFSFNRRDFGRLIEMIRRLNDTAAAPASASAK